MSHLNWVPSVILKPQESVCIYCGDEATEIEHLIPLVFLDPDPSGSRDKGLRSTSCGSCNRLLGASYFDTLDERINCVNNKIYKKLHQQKKPNWSEDELAELAPGLRARVLHKLTTWNDLNCKALWVNTERYYQTRAELSHQAAAWFPDNADLKRFMRCEALPDRWAV